MLPWAVMVASAANMAQLFDRGLVLALKLAALICAVAIFAGFYWWRWAINYPHQIGAPPVQPLPFSHLHHVGEDGIDCRYCHTSVETSPFAGIPNSDTCMTCHSQLFRDVPMFRGTPCQRVDGLAPAMESPQRSSERRCA